MDFFEHQEAARRRTAQMVALYCMAVVLIVAAIYFAVAFILRVGAVSAGHDEAFPLWNSYMFMGVAAGASAVILGGTLYKIRALSEGGRIVAEMLGGRLIESNTTDQTERRLLNVVEEMAIASGAPPPSVYLLQEERGINAFAAGFHPSDAVIAVTRGCATNLSRDELQGVIGHEFSHILNGDMRLNIRLMGVLNGILVIALIGYWLMRSVSRSGAGYGSGRGRKGGGVALVFLIGLALMTVGYIGVFFGKLIKSAVSRQREFLADASSVQFTRNPGGLAGALRKILDYSGGSRILSPRAEEASHLFFSNGLRGSWFALMATHPALEDRIERIDASFLEAPGMQAAPGAEVAAAFASAAEGAHALAGAAKDGAFAVDPSRVAGGVGSPTNAHLKYAAGLLSGFPQDLLALARDISGAQAIVYSLLIGKSEEIKAKQLSYLARESDERTREAMEAAEKLAAGIGSDKKIPLVDMCLPALRRMTEGQYRAFRENALYLASADMEIDIFEYALMRIVVRNLDPVFSGARPESARYSDMREITGDCVVALGVLAWFGNEGPELARKAFESGVVGLSPGFKAELPESDACSLEALDRALDKLAAASPTLKKRIVGACAACVAVDGRMTVEEGEILRAIADSLECPMPPFLQRYVEPVTRD